MDYQPKIKINENGNEVEDEISVEFQNVSFRYSNSKEYILKNINFLIEKGKKVAIVGENGAGKTTIINLLLHLYEPNEGEIYINSINYKEYRALMDSINIITQDIQLYAVTIAENILMRAIENKEEDEKIVRDALENVGLYEKVCMLPKGIYTKISKEFNSTGVLFSGGEYQRLAIARAYAKNSKIIILDEPSSSLDPIAEQQILETMFKIMKDKTVIIISHRLTNIKLADKIYMIKDGIIVEEGTHKELMSINGKYANMQICIKSRQGSISKIYDFRKKEK